MLPYPHFSNPTSRPSVMPWPDSLLWRRPAQPSTSDDTSTKPDGTWATSLNRTDYTHYTSTQTVAFAVVTSATTLALVHAYKTYIRRIPGVDYLKPGFFRRRSLYGYVTSVGDGDGFRLFHTPGGRLMGWGSKWRPIGKQGKGKGKKSEGTLSVRIAGIDAPEMAHFGNPAQPHSQEAFDWLTAFVGNKFVRVFPYRKDQYERVVCAVYRRRFGFWNTDVGLQMLKRGLATVYEAKSGSEFGEQEDVYRAAEADAKARGVGIWAKQGVLGKLLGREPERTESPREYKTRIAHEDKAPATKTAAPRNSPVTEEKKPGLVSRLLGGSELSSSSNANKITPKPTAPTPKTQKQTVSHSKTPTATRKKGK